MYYREHGTKTHSQVLEANEISSYIELQEEVRSVLFRT